MKAAIQHKHCFISPGQQPRAHMRPRQAGMPRYAPREDADAPGGASGGQRARARDLRGAAPRVLLIDSDAESADALTRLFTPEAQVLHVATLAAARQLLQVELFSLVILDPVLSDGDGKDLMPALATTPLLLYSARQPDARVNVHPYLPKPWTSPRQLWSTVSRLLGLASPLTAGD